MGRLLPPKAAKALRVFFVDGHSGPMNDMVATLKSLGVQPENIEAMLLAQAEQKRSFIDVLGERLRTPPPSSMPEKCKGRLLGKATSKAVFNWLKGNAKSASGGECMLLQNCERKRCRDSLSSDSLRREFAIQFGAAFEAKVDVVACNFPTWQASSRPLLETHAIVETTSPTLPPHSHLTHASP